jgi:pyridoxal phosphate enzyme (YggS family)
VTEDDVKTRLGELRSRLQDVHERVDAACVAAGRRASDVTVIAVTKSFPAADVRLLAQLGVTDVGENRDQEARAKREACADLELRWHFVGQLQANKARSVASYADVVHSVDRLRLVEALSRAAIAAGRELTCLVQVALADAEGRGGARPAEVASIADVIAAAAGLSLGGVMAVAPLGRPAEPAFAELERVAEDLRVRYPTATVVSAGMSGDLEAAVAHGATHVRIGTALLGHRASQVR